jgi:hypothetical protein
MTNHEQASDSRRRLRETAAALLARVEQLIAERGPLLRAAFQLRGTRCGKATCKCARGELHPTAVLVVSQEGKRRSFYVRPTERAEVQRRVERYQRVRARRAELKQLTDAVLVLADALLAALLEPHRPERAATDGDQPARRRRKGPVARTRR